MKLAEFIYGDYIFYFAYMQPAPKSDVLNLWANPDELAAINNKPASQLSTVSRQIRKRSTAANYPHQKPSSQTFSNL
jgi:hypothetical protein